MRGCLLLLLCAFVSSAMAACNMNGNWIFYQGTTFPGTTISSVGVTQTGTQLAVTVAPITNTTTQPNTSANDIAQAETWKGYVTEDGDYVTVWIQRDGDGKVLQGTVASPACNRVCFNCTQTPKGAGSGLVWRYVKPSVTHVHVVFMTHLDVGYTLDTSKQVLDQYFTQWFPKAYATAQNLRERGGEEQFAWTTHPWLINRYLNNATGNVTNDEIQALKQGILEGDITWHAGPMNMEAEVSERGLFDFGLSLSHDLDTLFNKPHKIGMSQKDVPGTTVGIVSLMSKRGIQSLHVGVNDFSTVPAVPFSSPAMYAPCTPFRWQDTTPYAPSTLKFTSSVSRDEDEQQQKADVSEVIAFWCSGYGEGYGDYSGLVPEMAVPLPPLSDNTQHELTYLMRVDNTGPQSPEEVLEGWRNIRLLYPNAKIALSSLDEFTTLAMRPEVHDTLPVVTSEIGDTWIRGAGSDPTKVRQYRAAMRVVAHALAAGDIRADDPRVYEALSNLIKLPEHTYGSNDGLVWNWPYDNPSFDALVGSEDYNRTVEGFLEQRGYIGKAVSALGDLSVRQEVEKAIQNSEPVVQKLDEEMWEEVEMESKDGKVVGLSCGGVEMGFDSSGAINDLVYQGVQWAGDKNTLALFQYRSHSEDEFDAFGSQYMLPGCRAQQDCGLCGFGKCGLTSTAHAETKTWLPQITQMWRSSKSKSNNDSCSVRFSLSFDNAEALDKYGAPDSLNVTYVIQTSGVKNATVAVDVQFHKRPTRMAESVWLSFAPLVDPAGWRLDKLGKLINPFDVVVNGSRWAHAVWSGVYHFGSPSPKPRSKLAPQLSLLPEHQPSAPQAHNNNNNNIPSLAICTLDAAVVMVDEPTPILFLRDQPITADSFHFNLFNNAWNTNFPVWLLDPMQRFQFDIVMGDGVNPVVCDRSQ